MSGEKPACGADDGWSPHKLPVSTKCGGDLVRIDRVACLQRDRECSGQQFQGDVSFSNPLSCDYDILFGWSASNSKPLLVGCSFL